MSRWHSVPTEWCIYTRIFSQPHFLQYKKTLKIITSLSLGPAPLEQTAFLGTAHFLTPSLAWPIVISGELPLWVARPTAQTDGLNDHLFRGTFSNPNPLTCSDGKSEICGSPASISRGRNRSWHGARAPSTQTFWRIFALFSSQE